MVPWLWYHDPITFIGNDPFKSRTQGPIATFNDWFFPKSAYCLVQNQTHAINCCSISSSRTFVCPTLRQTTLVKRMVFDHDGLYFLLVSIILLILYQKSTKGT